MSIYENRSISRGFMLLECVRRNPDPLRLIEIADATGLHTATAFRLLSVLCEMGYLSRGADDCYSLGYRLFKLADPERRAGLLRDAAHDSLVRLAREMDEQISLGELRNGEVVIYDSVIGDSRYREAVQAPPPAPYASAIGKLLLAYQSEATVIDLYRGRPMRAFTRKTITSLSTLVRELSYIRRKGGSCDYEEALDGIMSHAVPVLDGEGELVCAISVSGWSGRMNRSTLPQISTRLRNAAAEIASRLAKT
ncbi:MULTISPECIES: IclR family transcriptional regulator [unclassified Bradyrhizobium]|uniref:IclR family transcriptional regulator n=1 Tax=unclassified Bradyrhizobium TaxID=2631580 RepID=UPI0023063FF6|nr:MULTISPECIES: IclR family transcriptional regulator [unclassified Bradyrhizobium]MDA9457575.1 hypothetical protein [Bradyrhizobium sp. CCBAU 21359]